MALTHDVTRSIYAHSPGGPRPHKAATDVVFYKGSIVASDSADSGLVTKGATSTTLLALGICNQGIDTTDDAGCEVLVEYGSMGWFANSAGGDEIRDPQEIGLSCYIVDDDTVARTNGGATRSRAGKVAAVRTSDGRVAVEFDTLNR